MILVGVSSVRVGAAWYLGLYDGGAFALSAAAVIPGLAGVWAEGRLRRQLPERHVRIAALALLAVIAVRLIAAGIAGL